MWFVHANLPIGRWTSVRTVDPHGENGSNPLLTLTLTTITSMQIQNKQASTPHHVHSTMPPKQNYCMYNVLVSISACENNKSKRVAYAAKYFIFVHKTTNSRERLHAFTHKTATNQWLYIFRRTEPVFLNVYGAQESIPRHQFRQPM